jgi:hypothetical protein
VYLVFKVMRRQLRICEKIVRKIISYEVSAVTDGYGKPFGSFWLLTGAVSDETTHVDCEVNRGVCSELCTALCGVLVELTHVRRRTGRAGVASFVMRSVVVHTMVCTRGVYTWSIHVIGY